MAFKPEVYVVVDEILTEVLRGQLSLELQVQAIEGIIEKMVTLAKEQWGVVDIGLCKQFCRVFVAPRAPGPLSAELLGKCQPQGEPPSKGIKGVQHKLVMSFAEVAYAYLGGDLSDKAAALARAALHSKQRTQNTEYRRVFKALALWHVETGGLLSEALVSAMGGLPREISPQSIQREEALSLDTLDENTLASVRRGLEQAARGETAVLDLATLDDSPVEPKAPAPKSMKPMVQQALPLQLGSLSQEKDEDLDDLYLPSFNDFEHVFASYPFMRIVSYEGQPHLGLGYLSGRLPQDGRLIRRNCAVKYWDIEGGDTKEVHFKKLMGRFGVLEQTEGETRRFIKVLPLRVGMVIRAWSNVKDEKDFEEMNRFSVVGLDYGVKTFNTEEEMKQYRAMLHAECVRRGEFRKAAV
jgi:hypothetical protein